VCRLNECLVGMFYKCGVSPGCSCGDLFFKNGDFLVYLQGSYEWPVSNVCCVTFTWSICFYVMNAFVVSDFNISPCLACDTLFGIAIGYGLDDRGVGI
jgi:hypothetical protein